jgi:hypothetical protein
MAKQSKVKGGGRKIGRNKRAVDQPTSNYVRGIITFDQYAKLKNIKGGK